MDEVPPRRSDWPIEVRPLHDRDAARQERNEVEDKYAQVAELFFGEDEWTHDEVRARAVTAINELAEARQEADALRRQVLAMSAPIAAACSRFGHLDMVLEMAHDPDGTENTNPWHACARDLWRAVKAATEGGWK
jgi:hypothetical protein